MKRFGVRIAGGIGVVVLGILAAAQIQQDDSSITSELEREFGTIEPAAPIAAISEQPWSSDTTVYRGNDSHSPSPGAVQLAAHEEPSSAPVSESPAASADAPPAFEMPAMENPGGAPAAMLSMPQSLGAPKVVDTANAPLEHTSASVSSESAPAMPTLDMSAAGPALAPIDSMPSMESPAAAAPQDFAAPQDMTNPPAAGLQKPQQPMPSPETAASDAEAQPVTGEPVTGENVLRSSPPEMPATAQPTAATPAGSPYQFQAAEMVTAPAENSGASSGYGLTAPAMQPAATPPANDPPSFDYNPASTAAASPPSTQATTAPTIPGANPVMASASAPLGRVASRDTSALPIMDNVSAQPGDRRWEGAQAPSVLIHKRAPEEVKVGKPVTFVIDVRNVGTADAFNVQVHDRVPAGMRLVDAMPQPNLSGNAMTWALGGLEPGGERSITLQLVAEEEGELGSVARVTFEAAASVRTIATRPVLRVRQRAPERVLIGQQLELEIEIQNTGTGTATGVVLQEDVPEGLEHPKGRQLDNLLGDLAPGETRTQILRLRATSAGMVENVVRLLSDDIVDVQDAVQVEIISPRVAVELKGPSKRFLERQATFNVALANTGTANATNVELVAYLDRGFTFVSTENEGQYDPATHAVSWSLAELPPGASGMVPLTLLPVEEGEQTVRLEVAGDLGVREKSEKQVMIDTLAELAFSVSDEHDPIETGSETTYEIRVTNNGSRGDSNVQLRIQLPTELELVSADRNAGTDGKGLIAFEPMAQMTPQKEEVYRVRVRGLRPGTHKIQAVLTSDQATVPVTKEESTTVYSDQ